MAREGQGNKGGGAWIPPERDDPGFVISLLIPTLTASTSNSPPLAAPYVTPPTLYDGQRLSAAIANRWLNNNNWLWGVGIRTHDTATGSVWVAGAYGLLTEVNCFTGYFRYAGVSKFLHGFWGIGGNTTMRIYVSDDVGRQKVYQSTSVPTAATALSFASIVGGGSTSFTLGNVYKVEVTLADTGTTPSLMMDFLALVTDNALSWPSLLTLADGTTPSAANLNTISTAENYLYAIASTPTGSSVKVISTVGYAGSPHDFYNGGFFMYGRDAATVQNRINVRSKFTAAANPVLTTCAIGSNTAIDTINLAQDGTLHNDSYALTVASYAPDTFYRIRVVATNMPTTDYIERITVGGALALSNPGVKLSHLDNINGVGGLQNIGGSGATMNLAEIRTLLHGASALQTNAGADTGFQFIAPIQDASVRVSFVGNGVSTAGAGSHRPHVWRVLNYMTNVPGVGGTLTVGGAGNSLPDTMGAWGTYDLQNLATLGYGMDYSLTGVVAGFETIN